MGVGVAPCWPVLGVAEVPLAVDASGRQGLVRDEPGLLGMSVRTLRLGRTIRVSRLAHRTSPVGCIAWSWCPLGRGDAVCKRTVHVIFELLSISNAKQVRSPLMVPGSIRSARTCRSTTCQLAATGAVPRFSHPLPSAGDGQAPRPNRR